MRLLPLASRRGLRVISDSQPPCCCVSEERRMQNDDVWAFSVCESARLTGLSVKSLRRLILRGQLDVVRVGSRVLVPAESLRRLLGQVGK